MSVSADSDTESILRAHDEAVRSYEVRFDILTQTVIAMRSEKMIKQISDLVGANLEIPNVIMLLSGTLYEQISGVTPMDLSRDPNQLNEELWFSQPRRLLIIEPLLQRLAARFEAL